LGHMRGTRECACDTTALGGQGLSVAQSRTYTFGYAAPNREERTTREFAEK